MSTPLSVQGFYDDKILSIWKMFFHSFSWLEKVCRTDTPPILIGSVLEDILQNSVEPWQRGHLALVCQGDPDPALFKRCLQPHAMHSHGRVVLHDYAFTAHNITLNAHCVFRSESASSVYTRWPQRLSAVSTQGRQSAYLAWGEKTVKRTRAVLGLGKNLESSESVSKVCRIKLEGYNTEECVFCREAYHLFEYDDSESCYRYAKKYEEDYRSYIREIMSRDGPTIQRCEACNMKGDETEELF